MATDPKPTIKTPAPAKARAVQDAPVDWWWDAHPLDGATWGNLDAVALPCHRGLTLPIARVQGADGVWRLTIVWQRPHCPEPPNSRCYYLPRQSDLDLVKALWPQITNPGALRWEAVASELQALGKSRGDLIQSTPYELLDMVQRLRLNAGADEKSGRKRCRVNMADAWPYGTGDHLFSEYVRHLIEKTGVPRETVYLWFRGHTEHHRLKDRRLVVRKTEALSVLGQHGLLVV